MNIEKFTMNLATPTVFGVRTILESGLKFQKFFVCQQYLFLPGNVFFLGFTII